MPKASRVFVRGSRWCSSIVSRPRPTLSSTASVEAALAQSPEALVIRATCWDQATAGSAPLFSAGHSGKSWESRIATSATQTQVSQFVADALTAARDRGEDAVVLALPDHIQKEHSDLITRKAWATLYSPAAFTMASKESQESKAEEGVGQGLPHVMIVNGDCSADKAAVAHSVELAKDLVNQPPNIATPSQLARVAMAFTSFSPDTTVSAHILERSECEQLNMGAFLSVSNASCEPPKFIHLQYEPPATKDSASPTTVALVGKGVTFDSGGYNIKSAASMIELMKFDMGGSASVLAAFQAITELRPNVRVHCVVAACENMISGKGTRPGDVVTASDGTTIEVDNTDAEGRLTLADALIYAQKELAADVIIDAATLTGACITALGTDMGGYYSNNDKLARIVAEAASTSGDLAWRLPLHLPYKSILKSDVADMKNSGGNRDGGRWAS